jgi:hypothetical protein
LRAGQILGQQALLLWCDAKKYSYFRLLEQAVFYEQSFFILVNGKAMPPPIAQLPGGVYVCGKQ